MANNWFNATGSPPTRGRGWSDEVRSQFSAISSAFDRLPDPASSPLKGFNGGLFNSPTIQNPVINSANAQSGTFGSASNPSLFCSRLSYLGAGPGLSAGPAESGTLGAFYRMSGTTRVAYSPSAVSTAPSFFMDATRNLVMGDGANELTTSATAGFFYLPTVNGAPTGAATDYTGGVPAVVDRANNRLYIRVAGTWRYAALT
jgi:hypothetical protein